MQLKGPEAPASDQSGLHPTVPASPKTAQAEAALRDARSV